ncbi:MAG TPA: hypothetical protein VE870_06820 [Bacteroidales bacterium]|nr:hypothetical protein [Bacteroidales bacterium]
MKKSAFVTMAALLLSSITFAQLSERQNDATSIKFGTRPTAGDLALTFALPVSGTGIADLSLENTLASGDFITMKYYFRNDLALRGAIKLSNNTQKANGDLIDLATNTDNGSREIKDSRKEYLIAPGIEKHFGTKSLFDMYTGADLLVGFGRNVFVNNQTDPTGDYFNSKQTSTHMVVGLGTVIGVSVFIAQLPVSVGIEYGINFKYSNQGKTHYEVESQTGGVSNTSDYYTSTMLPGNYSSVKNSTFGIVNNEDVRIVLNIYFNK